MVLRVAAEIGEANKLRILFALRHLNNLVRFPELCKWRQRQMCIRDRYADCPAHPTWLEPDEWHGNAQPEQLQVLSAHPAHRLHSQLNYSSLRERYAVAGREPVTLNSADARARGIVDGDVVRVWNQRGQVLAGAVVSDGIKPGVICIHQGAWPDLEPSEGGICKNGAVNVLTKDLPSSKLGNGCAGNTALAWVEKYQGPELTLTAFDPPASS